MDDWHETEIRVRYAETDQMGIVHHANYLIWFEAGRSDLCRASDTRNRSGWFVRRVVHRSVFRPALDRLRAGHAAGSALVLGDGVAATAGLEAVASGIVPPGAGLDSIAGGAGPGEASL